MEDSRMEWHKSRFSDIVLAFLWSYVIVSLIVLVWATSDIGAILMIIIALVLAVMVAAVNLYHVIPYKVGISEEGLVFRHRIRFRKPRYQKVPWQEITKLESHRPGGRPKALYTAEGVRHLRISDETADKIERLWKKAKGDSKDTLSNGS